jgi:hypothetical protein
MYEDGSNDKVPDIVPKQIELCWDQLAKPHQSEMEGICMVAEQGAVVW